MLRNRKGGHAAIDLHGRPGFQTLISDLFGEAVRVSRGKIGFLRQFTGYLVVTMAIGRGAHEHRRNHQRVRHADYAHHV